jgi:putative phosphotransacetylase
VATMDENLVREIVTRVVSKLVPVREESRSGKPVVTAETVPSNPSEKLFCETIPAGVSNRHVHITREDFQRLFGSEREMTVLRPLSQPGQFAAQETLAVATDRGRIDKVRLLGPFRSKTQVELSQTDARQLGISPPVRKSGKLSGTPGAFLEGPLGRIDLSEGVIIAERHIHITPADAQRLGVEDGRYADVHTAGERPLVFKNVLIRVSEEFSADFHLDTDEANAAGLKTGDLVQVCFAHPPKTGAFTQGKVISERMLREALRKGESPGLDSKAKLTPSARDLAYEKGLLKR